MPSPPRLQWLFSSHPIFFIIICAHNRRRILAKDFVHNAFTHFALRGAGYGVWTGRYVLMPDHIHFFAAFGPESLSLSKWLKSMKNAISKVPRTANIPSPHWEKGSFDHVIRSAESYEQEWLYVRDNPVRAGLVARYEDWEFAGEIFQLQLTKQKTRGHRPRLQ